MNCGKHIFIDKKEARSSVNRMGNKRIRSVRAYYCSICNGWHVTSKKNFKIKETRAMINELESLTKIIDQGGDVDGKLAVIEAQFNIFKSKFKFFSNEKVS